MSTRAAPVKTLLNRLDTAWAAFNESWAGALGARPREPGVVGNW